MVSELDRSAVGEKRCDFAYSDLAGDEVARRVGNVSCGCADRVDGIVGAAGEQRVGTLCGSGLNIAEASLLGVSDRSCYWSGMSTHSDLRYRQGKNAREK